MQLVSREHVYEPPRSGYANREPDCGRRSDGDTGDQGGMTLAVIAKVEAFQNDVVRVGL